MKRNCGLLAAMMLMALCSFAPAKPGWREVSNKLYSFSVPTHWVQKEDPNGKILSEWEPRIPIRGNTVLFHLSVQSIHSPAKNEKEPTDRINLVAESYERKDGGALSIDEIWEMKMSGLDKILTILSLRETAAGAGQKRFVMEEISDSISAATGTRKIRHNCFYLLFKSGETVHFASISIRTSELNPESQALINDILDSFRAKQK
ncbi:MAG: hypothetical protein LBJ01_04310 [Tannerella sp.]|jgi:hypothetical protein|nr:hypothetical protein [Tannerella sp.]